MAKRGLPERTKMRHDAHYVEELSRRSSDQFGAMLPIALIEANPEQPRMNMGNIEELAASIREKGVLEPILVRNIAPSRYQIISGERRFRAAQEAGLEEIPAIEIDADDREVLEIALVENIQRKDLTPFEESEGLLMLQEKFDYTHDRIAKVLGKSRSTVTETLLLNSIPDRVRMLCAENEIFSKSVLVQIARAGSVEAMEELILRLAEGGMDREELRKETRQQAEPPRRGRPKNFTFTIKDRSLPFSLNLSFKKADVEKREVVDALKELVARLEKEIEADDA
jgi:ParB family transcriptional regulator, chromosome partitioning protein